MHKSLLSCVIVVTDFCAQDNEASLNKILTFPHKIRSFCTQNKDVVETCYGIVHKRSSCQKKRHLSCAHNFQGQVMKCAQDDNFVRRNDLSCAL